MLGALLLSTLAGCATTPRGPDLRGVPPPPATPLFDDLIIEGRRAGPVSLGMTAAQLHNVMGEPMRSLSQGNGDDFTTYEFPDFLVLVADDTQTVYEIALKSHRYATALGLHLGDSVLAAHAAYPGQEWRQDTRHGQGFCYGPGLAIWVYRGQSTVGDLRVVTPNYCR